MPVGVYVERKKRAQGTAPSRAPAQQVFNAQHQKELLEKSHLRGSITRCPTGVEKERQTKMKGPEGMETRQSKQDPSSLDWKRHGGSRRAKLRI